jgi:hypothetical protein
MADSADISVVRNLPQDAENRPSVHVRHQLLKSDEKTMFKQIVKMIRSLNDRAAHTSE